MTPTVAGQKGHKLYRQSLEKETRIMVIHFLVPVIQATTLDISIILHVTLPEDLSCIS